MHTKDLEAAHLFNLTASDVVGRMSSLLFPKAYYHLILLIRVFFVMAPAGECSYLLSAVSLILDCDEAQQTSR